MMPIVLRRRVFWPTARSARIARPRRSRRTPDGKGTQARRIQVLRLPQALSNVQARAHNARVDARAAASLGPRRCSCLQRLRPHPKDERQNRHMPSDPPAVLPDELADVAALPRGGSPSTMAQGRGGGRGITTWRRPRPRRSGGSATFGAWGGGGLLIMTERPRRKWGEIQVDKCSRTPTRRHADGDSRRASRNFSSGEWCPPIRPRGQGATSPGGADGAMRDAPRGAAGTPTVTIDAPCSIDRPPHLVEPRAFHLPGCARTRARRGAPRAS